MALPDVHAFATPLGSVPLDIAAMEKVKALPFVSVSNIAHAQEHSLEVHLPFLQNGTGRFCTHTLVVGETSPPQVAQVLEMLWGGDETLR